MSTRKPSTGAGRRGQLRIIGGRWRGRKLTVADVPGLRPSPDRVRETLFNWLAPDIQDLRVLDLFAGTGALGFEALSRGAGELTLVEQSRPALNMLRDNARLLQADEVTIVGGDALQQIHRLQGPFDLVFLDPPFAANLWLEALNALPPLLASGHRVYLETPRDWAWPAPEGWQIEKEKAAADVVFRLLHYSGAEIPVNQNGEAH